MITAAATVGQKADRIMFKAGRRITSSEESRSLKGFKRTPDGSRKKPVNRAKAESG
jgi:hypothetical protein